MDDKVGEKPYLGIKINYNKEKKLDKFNISYTFYDAIDGQMITDKYMESNNYKINNGWKDPFHNRKTTLGEIGCSLSHYNVMKLCLESENEISLILEDDADFSEDFIENLEPGQRALLTGKRRGNLGDITDMSKLDKLIQAFVNQGGKVTKGQGRASQSFMSSPILNPNLGRNQGTSN